MMEFEFPKHNLDADFDDDTGFPFDDHRSHNAPHSEPSSSSSSSSAQPPINSTRLHFDDHLRDIATRFPQFAEHIRPGTTAAAATAFPRERVRRDPWARDEEFDFGREYFDIPAGFESRFARPREFYPPNTQTHSTTPPCPPTRPHNVTPPPTTPKPAHTQITQKQTVTDCNTPTPATHAHTHNTAQGIQQSNTVDLGQVQPPSAPGATGECRGQRSMSAPPTDGGRTPISGKRYVSSIQIPVLQRAPPHGGVSDQVGGAKQSADMGASNTTPKPPPTPQRPNEYVIPIHIEGRDEPIAPKQNHPLLAHAQQPPTAHNRPLYTAMKEQFAQQQKHPQKDTQQQKHTQKDTQPQKHEQNDAEEQKDSEFEQQDGGQQRVIKPSPLRMIQLIQADVSALMGRVDKFAGRPRSKEYIYLDEMLTRNLLKLDDIETEGKEAIRGARREAIKCIEGCICILEAKANANLAQEMALVVANDQTQKECMNVAEAEGAVQGDGGEAQEPPADVSVT